MTHTYTLPTTDPPQNKRLTQTESEGLETNLPSKWTRKKNKPGVTILISDKKDFKTKAVTRDKEGHYIILKEIDQQENTSLVNIHAPNKGARKCIKKIWEDIKEDIYSNTVIVGDFNTPLSKMDRSSKQNQQRYCGIEQCSR